MKKFVVTYHMPAEAMDGRNEEVSPEEAEKGMQEWYDWAKRCGDHLIDLGLPLINGQFIKVDGSSGNSQRAVAGYSILQARDMEHAKELLTGHPHLNGWNKDCEIEVHESMPLPG